MKQAVIIGATSGIGRGLAERLAAAGWTAGWTAGWLLSLAVERSSAYHYRRLRQWPLFLVVALLIGIGILAG